MKNISEILKSFEISLIWKNDVRFVFTTSSPHERSSDIPDMKRPYKFSGSFRIFRGGFTPRSTFLVPLFLQQEKESGVFCTRRRSKKTVPRWIAVNRSIKKYRVYKNSFNLNDGLAELFYIFHVLGINPRNMHLPIRINQRKVIPLITTRETTLVSRRRKKKRLSSKKLRADLQSEYFVLELNGRKLGYLMRDILEKIYCHSRGCKL